MTVTQRTVVTCDHDQCDQKVDTAGAPSGVDLLAWLEQSGWIQFRSKVAVTGSTPTTLNFCPTHLAELRLYFGSLDSSAGLTLSQQGAS